LVEERCAAEETRRMEEEKQAITKEREPENQLKNQPETQSVTQEPTQQENITQAEKG
jgi:hypothetical protein